MPPGGEERTTRAVIPSAARDPVRAEEIPRCTRDEDSFPLRRRALQLFQQDPITLESIRLNLSLLHRSPDPAARLAHVPAVAVPAFPNEVPHLGKAAGQL